MSKKSQRNLIRRRQLVALRAELTLTLEDKLQPHHLQYNGRKTEQLIREFREFGALPYWAKDPSQGWAYSGGAVHDNHSDAMADAVVYGIGIHQMIKPST